MFLTREQQKKVDEATPMDDMVIRLMLRKNLSLAELICRVILTEKDLNVVSVETQYDASRGGIARGVTLDAIIKDEANRVHNIEVQIDTRGLSPERGRYHASILDVECLDTGDDFTDLPETFVIFICDHDPYKMGKKVYWVDRIIRSESGEIIEDYGDRQHILYVNGDWRENDDLGKLMHDFHCAKPEDMYFPLMAERLHLLKETEVGRMELSGLAAMFVDDERREIVERMLDENLDTALIARIAKMPIEQIDEIAKTKLQTST